MSDLAGLLKEWHATEPRKRAKLYYQITELVLSPEFFSTLAQEPAGQSEAKAKIESASTLGNAQYNSFVAEAEDPTYPAPSPASAGSASPGVTGDVERMWCLACGTVTRDGMCDCSHPSDGEPSTQNLVNYADKLQADLSECLKDLRAAEVTIEQLTNLTHPTVKVSGDGFQNSDGGVESRHADKAETPIEKKRSSAERSNSVGAGVATGPSEANVSGDAATRWFLPLSVVGERTNHDPGEHAIQDAYCAYVFKISGSRDNAEAVCAGINASAKIGDAAEMRERAAKACEGDFDSEMKAYGRAFAAIIRALPLTPEGRS